MKTKKIIALIPARLASTRFPEKLLKEISGKTILQMTYEAVKATKLFSKIIAVCDDEKLIESIHKIGGETFLSKKNHESGSDRIAEAANFFDADIIINIQGDEPFITKTILEKLILMFENNDVEIASVYAKIKDEAQIQNPNCVKVLVDKFGKALYFSRSPIPYSRSGNAIYYKHVGIYGYTKKSLQEFISMPQSNLEKIELLENLRWLENGKEIYLTEIEQAPISIDTEDDFIQAQKLINSY